ncbi:hypothetical protein [Shigella sp. FC1967]|uniref:hypothetical protein n=1 Tax=Shigella sp. FC1967 TaxID=1898041 RepID=UPI00257054C0|nr:hypothetical protein [Shigella sp. FC1967]
MAYEFLTQATLKKLATGETWQRQINDESIIDVSLNAGQLMICQPEIEENFIPFSQKLTTYCEQLALKFPFIEFTQPQEFSFHIINDFLIKKMSSLNGNVPYYYRGVMRLQKSLIN